VFSDDDAAWTTVHTVTSASGTLDWQPLLEHLDLAAPPVAAEAHRLRDARVAGIDATLADTAAFCAAYDVAMGASANCVIVAGRRGEVTRYAAVLVLATMRADINGVVRRELDARKCSFAAQADAVALTRMEFGGITPLGLPREWPPETSSSGAGCAVRSSSSPRASSSGSPEPAACSSPADLLTG